MTGAELALVAYLGVGLLGLALGVQVGIFADLERRRPGLASAIAVYLTGEAFLLGWPLFVLAVLWRRIRRSGLLLQACAAALAWLLVLYALGVLP